MASETDTRQWLAAPADAWPPDDTEESVTGTVLHQTTIVNLRRGINEVAHSHAAQAAPERNVPWHALNQTPVLGLERRDGSRYKTMPDVFVYRRPIDPNRGSVSIDLDGPPALIIEVLSESTHAVDLNLERGKGYSYARAGVREYLTIDPTGAFAPEGIRAWRLVGNVYHPWAPDIDGRWRSREIGVAFALEGVLATVYAHDGRRMLHEGEVEEERARIRAALARRDEELARRDEELAELRRLLDELRGQQL